MRLRAILLWFQILHADSLIDSTCAHKTITCKVQPHALSQQEYDDRNWLLKLDFYIHTTQASNLCQCEDNFECFFFSATWIRPCGNSRSQEFALKSRNTCLFWDLILTFKTVNKLINISYYRRSRKMCEMVISAEFQFIFIFLKLKFLLAICLNR